MFPFYKNTIFFLKKQHMILFRYYDQENRIDRAWYDSSNIVYSECDDNLNDYKTLRIVFKTGDLYEYKEVDVNDYLMFMAGGTDGSNGKAFYKYIRPKYEVEKKERLDLNAIKAEMEKFKEIKNKENEEKHQTEKNEKK